VIVIAETSYSQGILFLPISSGVRGLETVANQLVACKISSNTCTMIVAAVMYLSVQLASIGFGA
jgi:hypothetical protein